MTHYDRTPYPGGRAFLTLLPGGYSSPGWPFSREAVADDEGRFSFDSLVEGSYRIRYAPPLDTSRRPEPSETDVVFRVGRSQIVSGVTARVWNATDVRGTVTDARGELAGDADVVLHYRDGQSLSTTTDIRGRYAFSYVHPGEATLAFRDDDESSWTWLGGGSSKASTRWLALVDDVVESSQQLRPRAFSGLQVGVSGDAYVGNTLFGGGHGGNYETTRAIQWLANGLPIAGATRDELLLTAAQRGARIAVRVTWSQPGYATVVKTSAATSPVVAGTLTAPRPTVRGTPAAGATIAAQPGNWTRGTQLSYQWYASGKKINGATKSTYKVASALVGKNITVTVTGKKAGYTTNSKGSKATAKVALSATPTISGSAKVGQKLTAKPGRWTSGTRLSYQWYANGRAISKATKSTFTVPSNLKGKKITVKVTGTKSGYATVSTTSRATAAVAARR
ncbi:hypothetical protein OHB93_07730 [Microbacterium sp. No. 7]|uniref:carboxypeptidase regulatory-like domain-containing protein n=1 Tax=Microbacterium sp. No. 7 TaxID=1714373 RepID=UPI003008F0D2